MDSENRTYRYLRDIEQALDLSLFRQEGDSDVLEAMRYSLLGGGKRVRGILTLATCEMISGDSIAAMPAACAIEMIHAYSLIHDDLPAMDDDDLRRGKPSCHIAFGQATAILAGDALLTEAFNQLCRLECERHVRQCVGMLAQAAGFRGMVLGQQLDISSQGKTLTPAQVSRMNSLKTGALLRAAVQMGAEVAGADESQMKALVTYADSLGVTFQIMDDILDQTSDAAALGKPVGSDSRNQKATTVSVLGIDKARTFAEKCTAQGNAALEKAFSRPDYLIEFANTLLHRKK